MASLQSNTNESDRIKLLHTLELLDTDPEPVFDRITRTLARSLDMPMAILSLIDVDRQWFKSRVGIEATSTPRDIAFCNYTIQGRDMLVVQDTRKDPRFSNNVLVTGDEHLRFYAGVPLRSMDGHAIATLCVVDRTPRQLSEHQLQILQDLADMATRELQIREAAVRSRRQLEDSDARVKASEARFQTIFERAGVGIALVAPDGRWLRVNDALCEIAGYSSDQMLSLRFQDLTHPDDIDSTLIMLNQLTNDEIDRYQLEKRYIRSDGQAIWVNLFVTKHLACSGELDYFIGIVEDIHARKVAESELQALRADLEHQVAARTRDLRSVNRTLSNTMLEQIEAKNALQKREAELSAVIENAGDAYVSTDESGHIRSWNKQAEEVFGWSQEEAQGQVVEQLLVPPSHRELYRERVRERLIANDGKISALRLELLAQRKQGDTVPVELRISTVDTPDQKIFCAFLHDISDRKREQLRREQEALHDVLTGLPNRRAMYERLPAAQARSQRHGLGTALLFIDLDGFKQVNDRLGHDAGDSLLCEIAARLRRNVRLSDGVFRLAGDEFTVLLEDINGGCESALRTGEKLLASINAPILLEEGEATVGASIGLVCCLAKDPRTPEEWVKAADTAMYEAKRAGKGRIVVA
jgi:diguanylate cyclase (GGDEF)-like protein/PAS domain S-box-containing protein